MPSQSTRALSGDIDKTEQRACLEQSRHSVDECEHLCQLLLININTIDTADTHTWYLAFSLVEI